MLNKIQGPLNEEAHLCREDSPGTRALPVISQLAHPCSAVLAEAIGFWQMPENQDVDVITSPWQSEAQEHPWELFVFIIFFFFPVAVCKKLVAGREGKSTGG